MPPRLHHLSPKNRLLEQKNLNAVVNVSWMGEIVLSHPSITDDALDLYAESNAELPVST